jgi:hypothetical protein
VKIEVPIEDDVLKVALSMRQRDLDEFMAVSHADSAEKLALSLSDRYSLSDETFGAFDENDEAIAIGAMVEHRPGVITLMFFATDDFPKIALPLTKFIRYRLFPQYKANGTHRIECVSMATYEDAHRWIQMIGLEPEAILPGYGREGQAFIQFSWVADRFALVVDDACPAGA